MRRVAALVVVTIALTAAASRASEGVQPAAPVLLDVPYVSQTEALCGGASVAMVQRYWGKSEVSAADFAGLVDERQGGIPSSRLVDVARRDNWQTFVLNGTADLARHHLELGRPLITLLQVSPNRRHYVVVVSWSRNRVVYHDPATLPFRTLSTAAFERLWAPTDHWMLLLLPPATAAARDAERKEDELPIPASCADMLERGVGLAAAGRLASAATFLTKASAECPESAAPLIEIAGVNVLQHDYPGAVAAAATATRLAPESRRAWRILAASLFLDGQQEPALDAWNQAGDLRLDLVRIDGLSRTRFGVVEQAVGLAPGTQLTASQLNLARRRLESVPALSAARLNYVPTGGGLTDVHASVIERPAMPSGLMALGVFGSRALIGREVEWTLASPTRNGETITASWRWWESRPKISLAARIPVSGWLRGVVGIGGEIERQGYGLEESAIDAVRVTRRRSARASFEQWLRPNVRWSISAGADRWLDFGTFVSLGAALEQRAFDDRVAVGVHGQIWPGARGFSSLAVGARWRSSTDSTVDTLFVDVNAASASDRSPLDIWPGAGSGNGRRILLRAHPLLEDGVVRSEAFGRQVAQSSAEWRHPLPVVAKLPSLQLQLAGFVDAAQAWNGPDTRDRVLVDTGIGLRATLSGQGGVRLDYAHGMTDGANAVSVSFELPWPRFAN
jgi:peptidase C39-like protein/surface antigen Omp85-like protein